MNIFDKIKEHYQKDGIIRTFLWMFKGFAFRVKMKLRKENLEGNYKLNNIDKKSIVEKNTNQIFIFATVPFYDIGGGQRSAQLTKIFNRMGYRVHYFYAFDSSESVRHIMEVPTVTHKNVNDINEKFISQLADSNSLFIFEGPSYSFIKYLEIAKSKKSKVIYENIDNWETSLGSMMFSEDALKQLLNSSDAIVGTAVPLVEQVNNYFEKYNIPKKPVYYLANAVDDELFNPNKNYEKPTDLILGEKTLIYYGSLWGNWFDWDLIKGVAKKYPNYSINLIGDYTSLLSRTDLRLENIHFLGLKKQSELPAYLSYSDIALLPFKVDEIGKYVSPLKIFEYISMNKIVLSTNLPDIKGYPNVYSGDTVESWCDYLSGNLDFNSNGRDEFIISNNWYNRCSRLLEYVNLVDDKCNDKFYNNISVVVLNYNNSKVIFRCVDTLLKHNHRYNYEIIVVDNTSTDGSYEKLLDNYNDKIKIFRNDKNGCSSGRNLGVSKSEKEYIIFLDSDEWILNDYWLDRYLEIIESNNKIGAIAWNAGWFDKNGYAYESVDYLAYRHMPPVAFYRNDIGYLATCGFLMKRDLFNKINGFDLRYDPTCYEDTDLSLAIRNSGYEIVYCPYLGVGHLPHQTTKSGTEGHSKLLKEKGDYFVSKWKKNNTKLLNYTRK